MLFQKSEGYTQLLSCENAIESVKKTLRVRLSITKSRKGQSEKHKNSLPFPVRLFCIVQEGFNRHTRIFYRLYLHPETDSSDIFIYSAEDTDNQYPDGAQNQTQLVVSVGADASESFFFGGIDKHRFYDQQIIV